jgi:hypothetical protein
MSRNRLDRKLALGGWQPWLTINRSGLLAGPLEWLLPQFERHHGGAAEHPPNGALIDGRLHDHQPGQPARPRWR